MEVLHAGIAEQEQFILEKNHSTHTDLILASFRIFYFPAAILYYPFWILLFYSSGSFVRR